MLLSGSVNTKYQELTTRYASHIGQLTFYCVALGIHAFQEKLMPFFDLDEQEEMSFLCVVRHTVLEGPLRLVRFTDSERGYEAAYGRKSEKSGLYHSYWMYASEVQEILCGVATSGPYGKQFISEISKRWAICDDWGDLGRAWIMSIPMYKTLNAYFGFAKFQPKISTPTQQATGRVTKNSYPGGSMQFVTRIGEEEKQWITGPLRTLDLSIKKL